jgi:hypothetical protein
LNEYFDELLEVGGEVFEALAERINKWSSLGLGFGAAVCGRWVLRHHVGRD